MSADQDAFVELDRGIASRERARRLDALSELVARFAHDFNNVLSTIALNLTLIEKRCTDPTALWFAASALRAADRGTGLAQRLLAFAGKQTIARAPAELNSLLARMRSSLSRTAGPKVELILRAAEDLWPVSVDPDQIEFALVQVASNAHDAMPEGGHLTVETSNVRVTAATADLAAGDYVALSIEDTGEGCSEAALERVFEPFFTTKTDQTHLGLGLSVVLGIAKQHGGTARVLPASGGGCRVEICLPRASEAEISASRRHEIAPQRRQLAKSTVLVVDDDPDLRAVARDGLEILGCNVLLADGGPDALEILKSHGPVDLLMVDVRMGGMDGLELIQRARGIWPGLKALVMTGGTEPPALLHDATRILRKPFRVDDLAQEIGALLSRNEPASQ
jgi:nitrogen-specific signal transduction histidine kinase/ActR/RegA family two-component response regulator